MTTSLSRNQGSKPKTLEPEASVLQSQLKVLGQKSFIQHDRDRETGHQKLKSLHCIRQILLEDKGDFRIRDSFRRFQGFETLISAFHDASESNGKQVDQSKEDRQLLVNLIQAIFAVLAAALQDHKGNQKYFRHGIEGGGWLVIRKHLHDILYDNSNKNLFHSDSVHERLFGCLLACAINDETLGNYFQRLAKELNYAITESFQPGKSIVKSDTAAKSGTDSMHSEAEVSNILRDSLETELHPQTIVQSPDALFIMYDLSRNLRDSNSNVQETSPHGSLAIAIGVLVTIDYLLNMSTRNLLAVHSTALLKQTLSDLNDFLEIKSPLSREIRTLATTLLSIGISKLEDAHFLFRQARSSSVIADLLLCSIRNSRTPSFVHFDLSLHGYASIELPGIGRTFPPVSSKSGYSLSIWFQVIVFDPDAHTTIFGAFDASQACFVLMYLEKDTHSLILQTSVSSSRPSVRFKSTSFKEQRWYHVVITHRRPKTTSFARASLFVDGEFVEQVKSQYPSSPPATESTIASSSSPTSNPRAGSIQAFLGTPQDLASKLGKGVIATQWRLASASLFADVLSDDLIAVYYELGPRYCGNYQDCLGSFQTYRASAALNLRNESLHPGKEKSDIVSAIRSKAGNLLQESDILLNISADLVLDDDDQNNIDETYLMKFISKAAGKNLRHVTRAGRNALAINGAIPSINEALLHTSGYAVLTGEPVVIVPQSLDDAAWRVGGCVPIGLALLESSQNDDGIIRALKILLDLVRESWRNSEAMEREHGFGVLSALLSTKLSQVSARPSQSSGSPTQNPTDHKVAHSLAMRALAVILEFVGYQADRPEESVINNPLAYRILLVDMDYWRIADPAVQKIYYQQFTVFGVQSKSRVFNTKRLARMRK